MVCQTHILLISALTLACIKKGSPNAIRTYTIKKCVYRLDACDIIQVGHGASCAHSVATQLGGILHTLWAHILCAQPLSLWPHPQPCLNIPPTIWAAHGVIPAHICFNEHTLAGEYWVRRRPRLPLRPRCHLLQLRLHRQHDLHDHDAHGQLEIDAGLWTSRLSSSYRPGRRRLSAAQAWTPAIGRRIQTLSLPIHICSRSWNCKDFSFINGYLKDLLNTKNETAKFHLTLYGSHMVNIVKGGLDFYFTTTQTIILFRKTKHPCQSQSTRLTLMKPQRLQFRT